MRNFTLILLFIAFSLGAGAQNIPVDFETGGNGDNWSWVVFENDDNPPLEIVSNPDPSGINTSATVAKFTARATGQPFAGCESLHGADIGSWTIDSSNTTIRIMVWKDVISDVGIKLVRFDNWSLGEIKIPNTLTNQWEQITFDFTAHIGNTYDQIVIFPDFNARSSENVIYFDNIYGPEATINSIANDSKASPDVYPNPVQDVLRIELPGDAANFESAEIFNYSGQLIIETNDVLELQSLDVSGLKEGVYFLNIVSDNKAYRSKFIKQ